MNRQKRMRKKKHIEKGLKKEAFIRCYRMTSFDLLLEIKG